MEWFETLWKYAYIEWLQIREIHFYIAILEVPVQGWVYEKPYPAEDIIYECGPICLKVS